MCQTYACLLSDPFIDLPKPDWAPNREVREGPLSHRELTLKTLFPASLAPGFWLDLANRRPSQETGGKEKERSQRSPTPTPACGKYPSDGYVSLVLASSNNPLDVAPISGLRYYHLLPPFSLPQ